MFQGPEWGWVSWGMGSDVSSPSGVWGGAPAEIEFGAFLGLTSDIRCNNFDNCHQSVVLPRPQTSKSKIFGEAMPLLKSD